MELRTLRNVGYYCLLLIGVGIIIVFGFKNVAAVNNSLKNAVTGVSENAEINIVQDTSQIQASKTSNDAAVEREADHTGKNGRVETAVPVGDATSVSNTEVKKSERVKQPTSLGEVFAEDVFLGDSITKGLSTFKYLNSANVCAKIGISTSKVIDQIDKAVQLNPKRVFILCGVNDLGGSFNKTQFTKDYTRLIKTVKTKLPDSKIYVQSILPVLPILESQKPYIKNIYINAYNAIIMKIAKEENVTYLNTSAVVKEKGQSIYATDGLHYKSSFYPLWLNYLKKNVN